MGDMYFILIDFLFMSSWFISETTDNPDRLEIYREDMSPLESFTSESSFGSIGSKSMTSSLTGSYFSLFYSTTTVGGNDSLLFYGVFFSGLGAFSTLQLMTRPTMNTIPRMLIATIRKAMRPLLVGFSSTSCL
jgi:hypothetical protein